MSRGTNGAGQRKRQRRAVAALSALGVVAGLAAGALAAPAGAAAAPAGPKGSAAVSDPKHPDGTPVACDGKVYLSKGDPDQLYTVERGPGKVRFKELGEPTPFLYNAIGVNPDDRFLYGTTFGDGANKLVRFDGKGEYVLNEDGVEGLPAALYISGTFDDEGNYFVLADNTGLIQQIDVKNNRVVRTIDIPALAPDALDIFDIAFHDGYLWGATEAGAIVRIDVENASADFFPGVLPGGSDFGGVFVYGNGDLGFFRNAGELIRVHVKNAAGSNPKFTVLSRQATPEQSLTNVDATSCFFDSSADLSVHKRGPKIVRAGDEITYDITVKNDHKGASSGWSLVDDLPARVLDPATDTEGCEISNGLLSCTGGPLREGGRVKITVSGTAADVTKPTAVPNTATVFGDDQDPRKKNNTGFASTKIKPASGDGEEEQKEREEREEHKEHGDGHGGR
ncbi:hypothetical protein EF912_31165 [Streptomyces sp. WAC07061]|uniref:DUF6923 family protein n=1 Tax=Streptomyces sp. WAC07061 TaxID=2487410 RepID=UPI000F7B6584|nr:DUF11 domain-containing protein [Streptomyces sp. WAC07061]RSS41780.1 hypothetical protein EF912_31165 [Streptomyces sp. WAC07061]